jgi:hypothetical protein
MQCPQCQHEKPPQAKFCLDSGARLARNLSLPLRARRRRPTALPVESLAPGGHGSTRSCRRRWIFLGLHETKTGCRSAEYDSDAMCFSVIDERDTEIAGEVDAIDFH